MPVQPWFATLNIMVCPGVFMRKMMDKCHIHKRYEAKRKPRAKCPYCWRMYLQIHPDSDVTVPDDVWDMVEESKVGDLTVEAYNIVESSIAEMIKKLKKLNVVEVCYDDDEGKDKNKFPFLMCEMNTDTACLYSIREKFYDIIDEEVSRQMSNV